MAKKGLGKGLSALIPEKELPSGAEVIEVPLEKIRRNPDQPRKAFRKEALEELAASIREHGVIQPLLLMPEGDGYILVAGERRLRASQLAGLATVPAILRKMGQEDSAALAIIENIQRENLTPLEESQAYQRLIQLHGMTQERLGETLGKSRSYITNSLRLLQLPESIREAIEEGLLSPSHGRSILSVPEEHREELGAYVLAKRLSVRELEELVRNFDIQSIRKKEGLKPGIREKDVHVRAVEKTLEESFGTKVQIKGKHKGSITLAYYSKEDLMRITDLLLGK